MTRNRTRVRTSRLPLGVAIASLATMIPLVGAQPAGAAIPEWCDYALPAGEVVGWQGARVDITVAFDEQVTDVEDVTVLEHWVGEGFDLGPAPTGDPVFSGLPAGYALAEPPSVDRTETGVTDADPVITDEIVGCSDDIDVEDSAYEGQPVIEFVPGLVTYGDRIESIDVRVVTDTVRTHHITETRTYTIVADTDDPDPTVPDAPVPDPTVPDVTVPPGTSAPIDPDVPGRPAPRPAPSVAGTVSGPVQPVAPSDAPVAAGPAAAVHARPTYAG